MQIAALFDVPKTTMVEALARAGVVNDKGYLVAEAAKVMIAHYRKAAESEASEATKDVNRQKKFDADLSEMKVLKEAGQLVRAESMARRFDAALVKAREDIRRLDGLTLDQKKAVCEVIASAKLPEDEE